MLRSNTLLKLRPLAYTILIILGLGLTTCSRQSDAISSAFKSEIQKHPMGVFVGIQIPQGTDVFGVKGKKHQRYFIVLPADDHSSKAQAWAKWAKAGWLSVRTRKASPVKVSSMMILTTQKVYQIMLGNYPAYLLYSLTAKGEKQLQSRPYFDQVMILVGTWVFDKMLSHKVSKKTMPNGDKIIFADYRLRFAPSRSQSVASMINPFITNKIPQTGSLRDIQCTFAKRIKGLQSLGCSAPE